MSDSKKPKLSEIRAALEQAIAKCGWVSDVAYGMRSRTNNVPYLLDLVKRLGEVLEKRAAQHADGFICRSYDSEWSCTCGTEEARALLLEIKE